VATLLLTCQNVPWDQGTWTHQDHFQRLLALHLWMKPQNQHTSTVTFSLETTVPSVLWHCWLGGRKGIQPVKKRVMGCWHGYLSGANSRLSYGPADATATQCLLLHTGYTFLVLAHPGSPGQRAVKRVCLCFKTNSVTHLCTVNYCCRFLRINSNENCTPVRPIWDYNSWHNQCVQRKYKPQNLLCLLNLCQQ